VTTDIEHTDIAVLFSGCRRNVIHPDASASLQDLIADAGML
jgi:hypothetical protein